MKKVTLAVVMVLGLTGCATDGLYYTGKTIYIGGKKVVVANRDRLDESTLNKLKAIDEKVVLYDKTRKVIRETDPKKDVN